MTCCKADLISERNGFVAVQYYSHVGVVLRERILYLHCLCKLPVAFELFTFLIEYNE